MKQEVLEKSVEKVETTIGELIATLTDVALSVGKSEKESYELASITLEKILTDCAIGK